MSELYAWLLFGGVSAIALISIQVLSNKLEKLKKENELLEMYLKLDEDERETLCGLLSKMEG